MPSPSRRDSDSDSDSDPEIDIVEQDCEALAEALANEDMETGRTLVKRLLKRAPENPRVVELAGDFALAERDHELAETHYRWLLEHPEDAQARAIGALSLGLMVQNLDDDEGAVRYFQRAAEEYRELDHPEALSTTLANLANALIRLGRLDEGVEVLREAIRRRELALARIAEEIEAEEREDEDRDEGDAELDSADASLEFDAEELLRDEDDEPRLESFDPRDRVSESESESESDTDFDFDDDPAEYAFEFEAPSPHIVEIEEGDSSRFVDIGLALLWRELGSALRLKGRLDEAAEYYERALGFFEAVRNSRETAECLNGLGILKQIQGDYAEAEAYHTRGLEMAEDDDDDVGRSVHLGNLTRLALHRKDWDAAEALLERAYDIDRRLENLYGIADYHQKRGEILIERGEFDRAEEHILKTLALHNDNGDFEDRMAAKSHLGVIYRRRGELDRAEAVTTEVLEMARSMNHADGIATVLDELATLRLAQKRPREARELWLQALERFRELNSARRIEEIEQALAKLDSNPPAPDTP